MTRDHLYTVVIAACASRHINASVDEVNLIVDVVMQALDEFAPQLRDIEARISALETQGQEVH